MAGNEPRSGRYPPAAALPARRGVPSEVSLCRHSRSSTSSWRVYQFRHPRVVKLVVYRIGGSPVRYPQESGSVEGEWVTHQFLRP